MDVVWDQDVRTVLAAIIGRKAEAVDPVSLKILPGEVAANVQLAIHYADELGKARAVIERKPPVQQHRPQRYRP